jgi:hypothetical protein
MRFVSCSVMPHHMYRITCSMVAMMIERNSHARVARTVPAGTIIEVKDDPANRLVEVRWGRKKALMFARDLQSRAVKISQLD